jgi:hypothetical protein
MSERDLGAFRADAPERTQRSSRLTAALPPLAKRVTAPAATSALPEPSRRVLHDRKRGRALSWIDGGRCSDVHANGIVSIGLLVVQCKLQLVPYNFLTERVVEFTRGH